MSREELTLCGEVGPGYPPCALRWGHEGRHAWEAPPVVRKHDILKVLLVTSGTLATAGNAYHVIAAHQMSEADCRWPVCKSVRENREEIHALVEKLKGEELAT